MQALHQTCFSVLMFSHCQSFTPAGGGLQPAPSLLCSLRGIYFLRGKVAVLASLFLESQALTTKDFSKIK